MGDLSREPSMEEILSSIRRVIARDDQAIAAGNPSIGDSRAHGFAGDDVLDLTEVEASIEKAVENAPMGAEHDIAQPVADAVADSPAAAAIVAPEPITPGPIAPELIAPASLAASRHSLDTLAAVMAGKAPVEAAPAAPVSGEMSVNALVEAALRPMLKQWLDSHLPDVVERLVAREISRITGKSL